MPRSTETYVRLAYSNPETRYAQLREAGLGPGRAATVLRVGKRRGHELETDFDTVVPPSEAANRHDYYAHHRDRGTGVEEVAHLLGLYVEVAYLAYEPRYQQQVTDRLPGLGPGAHWDTKAVCGRPGLDPDLWTVPGHITSASSRAADAPIALCRVCPVRDRCLSEALQAPEEHTQSVILGGLTPRELKVYRVLGVAA